MRPTIIKSALGRFFFVLLLSFILLQANAQGKLKPDPEKARKEIEYLNNQKKAEQLKNSIRSDTTEYSIRYSDNLIMITFNESSKTSAKDFFQKFRKMLNLQSEDDFVFINSHIDNIGFTQYRYDQYYKGVLVKGGQFILQERDGRLVSADGKFYGGLSINIKPAVNKDAAIKKGLKAVAAKRYLWQNEDAQKALKKETNDPDASYYPRPELVIAPKDGKYAKGNFRLCHKVAIVSVIPIQEVDVFVDAHTGEIINRIDKIAHSDVVGSNAATHYYGPQKIVTDSYNGSYRLQESASRPIKTLNMLNSDDYRKAIDFTNILNNWISKSSVISYVSISKVKHDWADLFEDVKKGAPDIFIEIRDINDNLIFGKDDFYYEDAPFPVNISIPDIHLPEGSLYTLNIYDYDLFSPNDLLGSFNFVTVSGSVPFKDQATKGIITGTPGYSGALDAHWGLEQAYDYYETVHYRSSYNGKKGQITSYIHPDAGFVGNNGAQAFWFDPYKSIFFGDGNGTSRSSNTVLDLCGHELTHGFIDNNGRGGLEYKNESGALNESFADIFGTSIEFKTFGSSANWTLFERSYPNRVNFSRSMKDPKDKLADYPQPDTYKGTNWLFGSADFGGVHINSGVQNKWFYLLSVGDKGKIDGTGFDYKVPAIGMDKAAKIAYRNMMEKLDPGATYKDAYQMSLKAAADLQFPNPSKEFRAVREAWFAVGVAKRPVISSFTPIKGSIGTTVTISGREFDDVSYVGFNTTFVDPSKFKVINNGTGITVDVPTGATSGFIKVVAGYDTVQSTVKFTVECTTPLNVNVTTTDASSFTVNVTGGTAPYTYSLDNVTFQNSNVFSGLATGRSYTAYVKDALDCKGEHTFYLSNPIQCNVQSGSGGQGTTFVNQILGTSAGSVNVDYEMYTIPDQMDVYYNSVLVASTGRLLSGSGTLNFNYSPPAGGPYFCVIKIYAPNSGTAWDFIAYCPVSTSNRTTETKNNGGIIGEEKASAVKKFQAVITPNPASANTSLRISGIKGKAVIILSDINGRELWRTTQLSDGHVPVPVSHLLAGTYMVTVLNNDGQRKTLKFVRTN